MEGRSQRIDNSGKVCGRNAQPETGLGQVGKMPDQCIDIDGELSFWIAVVGIDADNAKRPWPSRRRHLQTTAEIKLEAAR